MGTTIVTTRECLNHFKHHHLTVRNDLDTRFVCRLCGIAGVGWRHKCTECSVTSHAYCQKCPVTADCCLHTYGKKHHAVRQKADDAMPCTVCRYAIRCGMYYYSCEINPNFVAHLPCFLIQKKTELPDKSHDHTGHYNCATCGEGGFGLFVRDHSNMYSRLMYYHPFCVKSSNRPHRNRTCFRHHDSSHGMAWTRPPAPGKTRPKCALCEKEITGYYYRCCASHKSPESPAIHPMCTEILRQDRKYHQKREVLGITVEVATFGLIPTNTIYNSKVRTGLSVLRNGLFTTVNFNFFGGLLSRFS